MTRKRIVVGAVLVMVLGVIAAWRFWPRTGEAGGTTAGDRAGGVAGMAGGGRGAARPPAVPASLAGKVTKKADGSPIAGAVVSVARAELAAMIIPEQSPTIVVVTDARGVWTVPRLQPGTYTIAATANGFVPGAIDKLAVLAGAKKTGVDFALDAGGTQLHGTVTDIGGGPIAGARVTAKRDRDNPLATSPELVALAGPDGQYQLTLADGAYEVAARHDDYTRVERTVELAGVPVTADFVLVPGASVRGTVVTRDGQPVPGALVSAGGGRGFDHGQAFADDDGKFVLRGLGSGTIELAAHGRGFASSEPTIVQLGIGEQADGVRIVVDRAFSISGTVVDKATRKGIAGIQLGVFTFKGDSGLALEPSADDGYFEVHGLKPGQYLVFAIGENTLPEIGKQVEVVDKDVTGVVIEMGRGVTLAGRVEPATVAALSIEMEAGKVGLGNMFESVKAMLVRGESDASGAFTLRNVPPGSFSLVARAKTGDTGKLAVTVAAVDQSGLVIKLEPRSALSGKVIDATGAAVAGVHVSASRQSLPGDSSINIDFGGGRDTADVTAPDGAFKIVGLDAGKVDVSVSDDSGPLAWARPADRDKPQQPITIEVPKAGEKTGVTLTVEARDGVIKGVVLDADKKPAADAWVSAYVEAPSGDKIPGDVREMMADIGHAPTLTGADGRFAIDKLRRGSYKLVVEGPRGASRAIKKGIKTGDTNVEITLRSLGTLSGTVTAGAAPVTTYDITCDGPRDASRHIVAKDGAYTIERVAPGNYKCRVNAATGFATGTVEVGSGPATLDFSLVGWGAITGTVVSSLTGAPVPDVRVVAGSEDDPESFGQIMLGKTPMTDASGRFTVEKLGAGKGHLMVLPKDGSFTPLAEKEYTLATGQRLDVGQLKVIPPRTGDAGTLGMGTTVDDGKLLVANVKAGGPAEQAGVQVGDRIVSIDARPVTDVEVGRQLLSSGTVGVGQVVRLGLERGGAPVAATLTAVKW